MDKHQIEELYRRYVNRTLSPTDIGQLRRLVDTDAFHEIFGSRMDLDWDTLGPDGLPVVTDERLAEIYVPLARRIGSDAYGKTKRLWASVAVAASIVLAVVAAWLFLDSRDQSTSPLSPAAAIAPGTNRATLTLANGRTIVLDEAQTGIIVGNEDITYSDGASLGVSPLRSEVDSRLGGGHSGRSANIEELMLSTPKGGTYQITLPDGSKVWLNANSTLKYPSRFSGDVREVFLEGEAFFEIKSIPVTRVPFNVRTAGQTVEVLGTQFNISAYADDPDTKTTLVEGKVRVAGGIGAHALARDKSSVQLSPGQQATTRAAVITVQQVNTEPYTAWKNGYFLFEDEPLMSVMSKIARWYDVEVIFADTPPTDGFNGIISRHKNLDQVLAMLERTKMIRFSFKDKEIHVSRYN